MTWTEKKLMDNVSPEPTTGCWLWTGAINPSGYGALCICGCQVTAHRFSWEITNGAITDGLHVLHRCDTRLCVNPSHLFLGTNQDNVRDLLSKNRQLRGDKKPNAKLTWDKVALIRASTAQYPVLGAQFGVKATTIANVKLFRTWKPVAAITKSSRKKPGLCYDCSKPSGSAFRCFYCAEKHREPHRATADRTEVQHG